MSKPLQIIAFPFLVLLAIPAIFLFVWVGMPLLVCSMAVRTYRLRKAVRTCPCANCGQVLGLDSLKLAHHEYPEPNPDLVPELLRAAEHTLDAICPRCGTRYSFESGQLILEEERPSGVHT